MKRYLLPVLVLSASPLCLADYQVDANLGILTQGVIEISGTTAAVEVDPGPPPVVIGGRNNASFARGLDLDETGNWGNEVVLQFEVEEPSIISLTSIDIEGDPDFFLLDSLSTEFDPSLSKEVATGAVGVAFLDGEPPATESLGAIRPGVYYLSVENFDGLDGDLSPGDSSFSIGISVSPATRENLTINLGVLAVTNEPLTLDTQGSDFDTELAVYNLSGEVLAENDNAPDSTHSRLSFEQGLPAGTYFALLAGSDVSFGSDLVVTPGGETGNWVLNFPPSLANPSGSEQETTVGGSVVTESQIFIFSIASPPSDFIDLGQVALINESFSIDTFGSNLDTVLGIFDRNGNLIRANDDTGEVLQSELNFNGGLPAGDYYLAVGGFPTIFADRFRAFMDPEASSTDSGSIILNHPDQGGAGVSNAEIESGEQQWYRFSVVEEYSESDVIRIVSVDFDPTTREFTVAWESDLPGPFNIHMGTGAELEAAAIIPDGLLDLVLAGVTSPVVVPVPANRQEATQLFLQVAR